jgi:hypothetical protein
MLKTSWLSLALPFLLLAACDGGGGSTRSTAEIQAEWDQHCDAFAVCPDGRDASACKAEFTCLDGALRADMLDKVAACQHARACGDGDDACYSLAAQGLTPSAVAMTFQNDCLAKRTTCTTAGTTFSDDFCYSAAMFDDSIISSMSSCLGGGCADVATCLEGALTTAVPACAGMN